MEQDDPKRKQGDAANKLTPSAPHANANNNTERTQETTQETDNSNKWSLKRHWKQASKVRRLEWGGGALIGFVALLYYGSQIYSVYRARDDFEVEHRPHVIISRPPEVLGAIACDVTERAIRIRAKGMRVWAHNAGKGDAIRVFVNIWALRLVPEQKTGIPFFDTPLTVTDKMCAVRPDPKMKMWPLYAGREVNVEVPELAGATSLVKTNSIDITGEVGKTPKDPERVNIAPDAEFRLYCPFCIYYSDREGRQYGTCWNYLFKIGQRGHFSCRESPIKGAFVSILGDYCDK